MKQNLPFRLYVPVPATAPWRREGFSRLQDGQINSVWAIGGFGSQVAAAYGDQLHKDRPEEALTDHFIGRQYVTTLIAHVTQGPPPEPEALVWHRVQVVVDGAPAQVREAVHSGAVVYAGRLSSGEVMRCAVKADGRGGSGQPASKA